MLMNKIEIRRFIYRNGKKYWCFIEGCQRKRMTSIIQKVRTSFATQLTLWVASLVTVISVVVVGLLAIFSQDVIFDETMDTTLQAMETTARPCV